MSSISLIWAKTPTAFSITMTLVHLLPALAKTFSESTCLDFFRSERFPHQLPAKQLLSKHFRATDIKPINYLPKLFLRHLLSTPLLLSKRGPFSFVEEIDRATSAQLKRRRTRAGSAHQTEASEKRHRATRAVFPQTRSDWAHKRTKVYFFVFVLDAFDVLTPFLSVLT